MDPARTELEEGQGEKGDYLPDAQKLAALGMLRKKSCTIAVPRYLVSGVLALVHSIHGTFGHRG